MEPGDGEPTGEKESPMVSWTWQLRAFSQRLFAALEKTNWPQALTHPFATAANGLFEVYNRIPSTPAHAGENVRCFGTELSNMCTRPLHLSLAPPSLVPLVAPLKDKAFRGKVQDSILCSSRLLSIKMHHCKRISFGMYVYQTWLMKKDYIFIFNGLCTRDLSMTFGIV